MTKTGAIADAIQQPKGKSSHAGLPAVMAHCRDWKADPALAESIRCALANIAHLDGRKPKVQTEEQKDIRYVALALAPRRLVPTYTNAAGGTHKVCPSTFVPTPRREAKPRKHARHRNLPVVKVADARVLPLPLIRGLSREESAAYIGVGTTLFDNMVSDGRMPVPKVINSRRVWDRIALDAAFQALPSEGGLAPKGDDPWSRARA